MQQCFLSGVDKKTRQKKFVGEAPFIHTYLSVFYRLIRTTFFQMWKSSRFQTFG